MKVDDVIASATLRGNATPDVYYKPTENMVDAIFRDKELCHQVLWYLDGSKIFENGSLTPWIQSDPYGPWRGSPDQVVQTDARTGVFYLLDHSDICPDSISQAIAGEIYTISCWLKANGIGSSISILATVS
ncbi:hypothetical protein I4U23_031086 [Adineta vaga]|nr:hypothetical protein I4U23_031086 [Adineta vaga]